MPRRMYTPAFSLEGTSRSWRSGDPKPKPSANPTKEQRANPPRYSCHSSPLGGAARRALELESGNAWEEEAGEGRRAIRGPPLPPPLNQCGRQPRQRWEGISYGTNAVAGRGWEERNALGLDDPHLVLVLVQYYLCCCCCMRRRVDRSGELEART